MTASSENPKRRESDRDFAERASLLMSHADDVIARLNRILIGAPSDTSK